MHISLILAHPHPQSFTHAIAHTAAERFRIHGFVVHTHDLYDERFDPILGQEESQTWQSADPLVEQHCAEIAAADGIVIVHPNWWGQPPAILKGWIDRVLRPGVAYDWRDNDRGEGVPIGLLRARVGLVFNTANTPTQREADVFGNPLDLLWRNCIFDLCGVPTYARQVYSIIATSTDTERNQWLQDVERTIDTYFSAS